MSVRLQYVNDKTIEVSDQDLGKTILELSLMHGINHIHACGGNAKCSTCRVVVLENPENLSPPNQAEVKLSCRKGFADQVRLACQTKVQGDASIRRVVLDEDDVEMALTQSINTSGIEKNIAVLFSDLVGFTSYTERSLPHDVVHVLNRYFFKMGGAVLRHQGHIDKYIGDGLMALFGIGQQSEEEICLSAIRAALEMRNQLEGLNLYLEKHFKTQLAFGVGIHFGPAILGNFGHPQVMHYTAIGDTVNTASRIESATRKTKTDILISEEVYQIVKGQVSFLAHHDLPLKGKQGLYRLHSVKGLMEKSLPTSTEPKLEKLQKRLAQLITKRLAPMFLRLVFHDAWKGGQGTLGLAAELANKENRGLEMGVEMLKDLQEQIREEEKQAISLADLIAMAGAVAVEKCGGPAIPVALGRVDANKPSSQELPQANMSVLQLIEVYQEKGLNKQDLVALSGGHTLGKGQGRPFTEDMFSFSNSYFQDLLARGHQASESLLPSDYALLNDEECLFLIIEYSRDRDRFFRDFSTAYQKLVAPR